MTYGVDGFQQVLHTWATRQLEEKSEHVGPFRIERVGVDYERGHGSPDTPADDTVEVRIQFTHIGTDCPAGYRCTQPGPDVWFMPDTQRSAEMLNELLAIADED
jgi:hypothetical protein